MRQRAVRNDGRSSSAGRVRPGRPLSRGLWWLLARGSCGCRLARSWRPSSRGSWRLSFRALVAAVVSPVTSAVVSRLRRARPGAPLGPWRDARSGDHGDLGSCMPAQAVAVRSSKSSCIRSG
jgi:hypothetical protein